jgi:hypothetical protein
MRTADNFGTIRTGPLLCIYLEFTKKVIRICNHDLQTLHGFSLQTSIANIHGTTWLKLSLYRFLRIPCTGVKPTEPEEVEKGLSRESGEEDQSAAGLLLRTHSAGPESQTCYYL